MILFEFLNEKYFQITTKVCNYLLPHIQMFNLERNGTTSHISINDVKNNGKYNVTFKRH